MSGGSTRSPRPASVPPAPVPRPRAVVVLTGSELVRGDTADRNGPFLARELTRLGLGPARLLVVGDEQAELERAVREGLEADLLVLSGGLGPTHDDRTVEVLARATGRPLRVDDSLASDIEAISRAIAERLGRPYPDFTPGVRKQASLPEGAVPLGLAGTAPAVLLEVGEGVAVALPGPPNELQRLWPRVVESDVFRRLVRRAEPPQHRVVRVFGPSESAVAQAVEDAGGETPGLEITVCAHDLEIRIDLFARDEAEARAEEVAGLLRTRFGAELFAEDERPVAELVLERCRALGLTLATAESCTGGLVAARLTDAPGASDVFVGGIVAYANDVKAETLGVPAGVLERHGAVSAEAAAAMAQGARAALGADAAVAVTGVAGPGGGTPSKPVGLVYVHAEAPAGEKSLQRQIPGDRSAVRRRATAISLHTLRRLLARAETHAHDLAG
jgi:nicotinamide-nucleotide amidase